MASRRDLSPEDAQLWRHVVRNVNPFHTLRHPTEDAAPEPPPAEIKKSPVQRLREPAVIPPSAPQPALTVGKLVDMDKRTARRLKRGELPVDGRIDLHGLTLDQAHGALASYIRGAHNRGARCVVVVTGKGKGGEGTGKIRRETPHWLNQAALRPLVLAVTEARTHDGGTGAFYVLLKRRR
ncbi:MAG: Smr/MutS family protein [Rhodospirillaceae bacterium]